MVFSSSAAAVALMPSRATRIFPVTAPLAIDSPNSTMRATTLAGESIWTYL
jgi:hypothetical protein